MHGAQGRDELRMFLGSRKKECGESGNAEGSDEIVGKIV